MAAVEQPVEMLEDVAVAAADARALCHVHDPQLPLLRAHVTCVEELPPALPEDALRVALALAELGAARDRLVVIQARRGEVEDAQARLPRSQAPVDILVGHRIALVQQPHAPAGLTRDVHARAGHRQHRSGDPRRAPVRRLEAIAMVEPLGRARVAHRAGELDAPVGIKKARAHGRHVVRLRSGVLQARKPARARLGVGVEHDDVALGIGCTQAPVDVRGEAAVLPTLHDVNPRDLA